MKIEIGNKPTFNPVSITITCETQKELNIWGKLFNHSDFCEAILGKSGANERLRHAGSSINHKACLTGSFRSVLDAIVAESSE